MTTKPNCLCEQSDCSRRTVILSHKPKEYGKFRRDRWGWIFRTISSPLVYGKYCYEHNFCNICGFKTNYDNQMCYQHSKS